MTSPPTSLLQRGQAPVALLERLLEELPMGVVLLDADGRTVFFNAYEETLAGRRREDVLGLDFFETVAPCMNVRELAGVFRSGIGQSSLMHELEFQFPFPHLDQPRDVVVRLRSIELYGAPYGCLYIEDVSARRSVERMKETLSRLLVHDLKNPLTVVAVNLQLLEGLGDSAADREVAEALTDAARATERLRAMVMNLLDITRLETGAVPLRRQKLDPRELVATVVEEARGMARARDLELIAEAEASLAAWSLDADLMRRAIDNLVENALRYAPRRSCVTVAARREAEQCIFEVANEGAAVPEELRERIFDPYVRVAGGHEGTNRGLGLTLVQLAARAHGGRAEVRCPDSGGSQFRIVLPAELLCGAD